LLDQLGQLIGCPSSVGLCLPLTAFVLGFDPLGLREQRTNILPDGLLQEVGAYLLVPAQPLPSEAIRIRAGATVVRIPHLPLGRDTARGFPIAAIAASLADNQPLEQETVAVRLGAPSKSVLLELCLDRLEDLLADQSRDIDQDLVLRCCINA